MQRKIFPFVRGVRGGPQPPSEDQFCENILSIFGFFKGKKLCFPKLLRMMPEALKNRLYFSISRGGGGPRAESWKFPYIYFLTLNPSLSLYHKTAEVDI